MYLGECYRPEYRRDTCETNYGSINNWREQFEKLVTYFKDPHKDKIGNIADLYSHFKITD